MEEITHLVDPAKEVWYHKDKLGHLWTCSCRGSDVSLCITIDESLKREGELAELNRQIAQKRNELKLLPKHKVVS